MIQLVYKNQKHVKDYVVYMEHLPKACEKYMVQKHCVDFFLTTQKWGPAQ